MDLEQILDILQDLNNRVKNDAIWADRLHELTLNIDIDTMRKLRRSEYFIDFGYMPDRQYQGKIFDMHTECNNKEPFTFSWKGKQVP